MCKMTSIVYNIFLCTYWQLVPGIKMGGGGSVTTSWWKLPKYPYNVVLPAKWPPMTKTLYTSCKFHSHWVSNTVFRIGFWNRLSKDPEWNRLSQDPRWDRVDMVTILPKMKTFKIPSLKTQILIFSSSKLNFASGTLEPMAQKCTGVQKLATLSTNKGISYIYFVTTWVSICKISTAQARSS